MNTKRVLAVLLLFCLIACQSASGLNSTSLSESSALATKPEQAVEQWGVFKIRLSGPDEGNPFLDVTLSAAFREENGQDAITVPGFYDGQGMYLIRFSPPRQGVWTYVTDSNRAELDAKRGSLTAVAPGGSNHGPLRVHKTFHFAYADGTPYYQTGTTCYAWIHQPAELQEQTLKTLSASPFNKLRMCIFPKRYVYNSNEPDMFPFVKNDNDTFDFTRFNPAFWRHLENRVMQLGQLGIEADLVLFHPYDHWGFADMDDAADDRYLRYAIARLSAFRNVWWSLANEWDLMTKPLLKGHRGNKDMDDWDRFFSILEQDDPFGRMRSIHNCRTFYDHRKPWATHASIQRGNLQEVLTWRQEYQKPIVVDECGYEGNIPQGWGKLSGPEMVRRFWIGAVCGGYVGHGETMRHPEDILWWSKGGALYGESPSRIAFLRTIMETLPYTEMTPARPRDPVLLSSKPGSVYLVYALESGPITLKLEGQQNFQVEAIDTWEMKTEVLDTVGPGEFSVTVLEKDHVLRIMAVQE